MKKNNIGVQTDKKFTKEQLKWIMRGFKDGLTIEQITMYAKPEFDEKQMREIYLGLRSGLSTEQISIYTKPEFDSYQMHHIWLGFTYGGLTKEQVMFYAKPEFNVPKMILGIICFKCGLTEEQVNFYINREYDDHQICDIYGTFIAFNNNPHRALSYVDEHVIGGDHYSKKMYIIESKINEICNGIQFDDEQIKYIRDGFIWGLTEEQILIYANPEFDANQMGRICGGFKSGLTIEQVKIYADPKIKWFDMATINDYLVLDNLTEEQIKFLMNYELFNKFSDQRFMAVEGFKNGLTIEQVATYIKPDFDKKQMREIMNGFKNGLTIEQVSTYTKPEYTYKQMRNYLTTLVQ